VTDVPGDGATPKADVHVTLVDGGAPFGVQGLDVDGGRDAVERHVDERGHTPRSRGPSRGIEPLPVGTTWLVHVHVGVDQAGQQDLVVSQRDDPLRGQVCPPRFEGNDAAGAYADAQ
jgi:hypothetical protein